MARLTDDDKVLINELYLKLNTYAAVARETGFSPSTVKKYVIPDYKPQSETIKKIVRFDAAATPTKVNLQPFLETSNFGDLLELSTTEKEEIKKLWEELLI